MHAVYQLVSANQADTNNNLSVRGMCRVLKVSCSGYYDWQQRAPSGRSLANLVLTEAIRKAHNDSDHTYNMPRVRAELREAGYNVSRKRVAAADTSDAGVAHQPGAAELHGDHRARPAGNGPHPIWSTASSAPTAATSCGSPI